MQESSTIRNNRRYSLNCKYNLKLKLQNLRIKSLRDNKLGKTTFVDAGFVIEPCLYALEHNEKINKKILDLDALIDLEEDYEKRMALIKEKIKITKTLVEIEYIYNSYEIDRISKEFDFSAHFLNRDFGIDIINLPPGKYYQGKNYVKLSASYLKGELTYDTPEGYEGESEIIKVEDDLLEKLIKVYETRIIPLFGEYDANGVQIKKGIITILENKDNPTGVRNFLLAHAQENGEFLYTTVEKNGQKFTRLTGYKPKNPYKYTIIITDHLRKLIPERGFNMKQTVDKFSEYAVELRNLCGYTFVHIIHLNRALTNIERLKNDTNKLFPQSDDIKETGNLSEDSNYVITLFSPNDDRYKLKKHFDLIIRSTNDMLLYPNMMSIHLVESRHCKYPQHWRVNMLGEVKKFTKFIKKEN